MATESSAVVRFINLVQKQHQPIYSEGIRETAVDLRPRSGKGTKIAVGVALVAGVAIAGGFVLGRGYFDSKSSPSSSQRSATPSPSVVPGAPLPAPAAAPAPAPAPVATPLVTVPPDVLAETGFDIRVSPPGRVSVDAQLLGTAPLRVRNLQPGTHVIDVEAPAGYFSRRIEVDLVAGDPQQVKIELDAIKDDAVADLEAGEPEAAPEKPRKQSKKDKKAAKEAARRAALAEKAAARAEARRVAKERAELKREAARDEKERREREAREAKEGRAVAAKQPAAEDDLDAAMAAITGGGGAKKPAPRVAALAPGAPEAGGGAPGTLMLGSKPLCDIYIDGKATGLKTPQRAMELAPGTYKIKLVNTDLGIDKTFKVKIAPGKTTRAIQDLTK